MNIATPQRRCRAGAGLSARPKGFAPCCACTSSRVIAGRVLMLTLLTLLTLLLACGRQDHKTLAKAERLKVTAEEFRFRRNLTPYIFRSKQMAQQNLEYAASVLGEKWMAQQARSAGLAEQTHYQAQMRQLEREFLFEALYSHSIAKQRDPDKAMGQLLRTVMADKTMHISQDAFSLVEGALTSVLEHKPLIKDSTATLSEQEAALFRRTFENLQQRKLVRFSNGDEWTVADFLERLSVGPYPLPSPHSSNFRTALKQIIRKAAELEYLSKAARVRGLSREASVSLQRQMWSDALLSQLRMQQINEKIAVSEEEIKRYHRNQQVRYLKKARTALTDSAAAEIDQVLRRTKIAAAYRQELTDLAAKMWFNRAVLDTLEIRPVADLVVKRHFPGRVVAPIVFPYAEFLPQLSDSTQSGFKP
jgi:hypothetical protein